MLTAKLCRVHVLTLVLLFIWAGYGESFVNAQSILLEHDGKVLSYPSDEVFKDSIRIEVLNVPKDISDKYVLKYRFFKNIGKSILLSEGDLNAKLQIKAGKLYFAIPIDNRHRFFVYNVWEKTNSGLDSTDIDSLKSVLADLQAKKNKINALYDEIDIKIERDSISSKIEVDREKRDSVNAIIGLQKAEIKNDVEFLKKEIDAFKSINSNEAVKEIRKIQLEIRRKREADKKLDSLIEGNTFALLVRENETILDSLNVELKKHSISKEKARIEETIERCQTKLEMKDDVYNIHSMGNLLLNKDIKVVTYEVKELSNSSGIELSLLGEYPEVSQGNKLFVRVLNNKKTINPNPFKLKITTKAGEEYNPTLVKPLKETTEWAGSSRKVTLVGLEKAYVDHLLHSGLKLRPKDSLSISITSYTSAVTKNETTKNSEKVTTNHTVEEKYHTLIDDKNVMQVHSKYRFNMAFGVVASRLDNPEFLKVKIADSTYRIDKVEDSFRVMPLLSFSFYLSPRDLQKELTPFQRVFPNPMLGFALNNPTKNFFLGLMIEPIHNFQIVGGVHLGKVNTLKITNEVDEYSIATPPTTKEKFEGKGFIGFSSNLKIFGKLFSK